ncbi:ABC transporter ATP-binding protein [Hydrogenophaga electricum]|uniref:ABC transporter ATP-binding protein n=1 Tax=Hydrogenophaga electricum TaxID=1230953 RepID=A0ABQ6C9M0_9BURK|nr:ABC transporter ATP-binding protein [Hydrogenophaga electricum]GLS16357.1 ABC transporter ATP-binding protein [Hydrogenophaga electricum]
MNTATVSPPAPARGDVQGHDAEVRFRQRGRDIQALAPVSLALAPGSFTSVIGPSGCGKSTLLNAIAGFTPLSSGSLQVDGAIVSGPSPRVGVMFQQYALFPWFTAAGNVEFALKRFGLPRAERRTAALQALDEVGLSGKADHHPGQLSGGMRQRVALARTLAARPDVLLMDEPFGALDAQTRLAMQELLLRIWEARRTTVLFITHDIDEALLLSDRVLVMSAAPGRFIDDLAIDSPRPRSVEQIDATYIARRNHLLRLLRDAH